jgi:hypothetical protein
MPGAVPMGAAIGVVLLTLISFILLDIFEGRD